ncbi:hypothetical protein CcaCcLH18_01966 [Colletotrichum camelliae]|nr:hypothetical protein CcaCcLH18_01966 [Colletotrichum camelliae]
MMTAYLRTPFPSLNAAATSLARGAGGQIFIINAHVVFKCPTNFDNPAPQQAQEMEESVKRISHEKAIHEVLMMHPHRNIVRCILCVPEGFFMERMVTTLRERIEHQSPPATHIQLRWIEQISGAVAWLEKLGLVHGDLRPANILLTAGDNIRLADFDTCVRKGEELLAASEPFCKLCERYETLPAGPISEQFALASCIYTIRFNRIPMADLDAPTRVQKIIKNEMPPTEDEVFGDLIQDCWQGKYASIADVYDVIRSRLGAESEYAPGAEPEILQGSDLLAQCQDFLAQESQAIDIA